MSTDRVAIRQKWLKADLLHVLIRTLSLIWIVETPALFKSMAILVTVGSIAFAFRTVHSNT